MLLKSPSLFSFAQIKVQIFALTSSELGPDPVERAKQNNAAPAYWLCRDLSPSALRLRGFASGKALAQTGFCHRTLVSLSSLVENRQTAQSFLPLVY